MLFVTLNLLLLAAVVFFFFGPPLALLHELGHALPLALAGKSAEIHLGSPDLRARPTFRIGKVEARIRRPLGFGGVSFFEEPENGFSPEGELVVSLGGPAASALAALAFGLLAYLLPDSLLTALLSAVSLGAFVQVVATMVPVRYPRWFGKAGGRPSDGLRALRAMGVAQSERPH